MVPQLAGLVLDGKYRLTQPLGEGGMGFVYAGEHAVLGRPLAVKFLRPELAQDATALARLRQEAVASSNIGSPHIVEVLDLGTAPGGMPFIVMEYLRGRTLAALLEAQPVLPVSRIARILSQALAGLAAAHARGIVHRDLKPENIFLVESAGEEFVKLLDFGVSKVRGDLLTSNLTQTGAVLGTPRYMAPEQAAGRRDVDHRVDLWAGGVILYRALTGRFPFDAENYNALLAAILMQAPPSPRQFRPDLPPPLEVLILTALAREPDRRFADAERFRRALQPWLAEPSGMLYAGSAPAGAPATGPAPSPSAYTPMPWPSGTPTPPGAPTPPVGPGTAPTPAAPPHAGWTSPATGGIPVGTLADRTVAPVDAQATRTVPARRRTGLWVALGLLLAAGLGSAVAWLAITRPWKDEPTTATASRAAAPGRPTPFAPHAADPDTTVEPGTNLEVILEPTGEDEAGGEEAVAGPEPDDDDEMEQAIARMVAQTQALLQHGPGAADAASSTLTPEQERQRRTYIAAAVEMNCLVITMNDELPPDASAADMIQRQADQTRRMEQAVQRHGVTMTEFGLLATNWALDPVAMAEVARRSQACIEAHEAALEAERAAELETDHKLPGGKRE